MSGRMYIRRGGSANRRSISRILMMLVDGEVHRLGEFYDWIAETVAPNMAMRVFMRKGGKSVTRQWREARQESMERDPEAAVAEGRRQRIIQTLGRIAEMDYAEVVYPEREHRSPRGHQGFVDPRGVTLQITQTGMNHLLSSANYSAACSDLAYGIERGLLHLKVSYNGRK